MIKSLMLALLMCVFTNTIFAQPQGLNQAYAIKHKLDCRCLPGEACWPKPEAWNALAKQLQGRLIKPVSPIVACKKNASSLACKEALKRVHNPFFLEEAPGRSQSQGWLHAWVAQPSAYAVEAKTTGDIVAAVNFAREHHLRLVIKGAGHDYLGRSNAPGALMIWTHNMRNIQYHKSFIPQGCKSDTKPFSAITVGAGTRWIEAYTAATTQHHQYVQGGGCTTVGAAGGFTQGGGFGSFSKKFGTGAAGVLQATIVTADGKVLVANQCQNKKLFWAIRGGGGSTFGVVSKMTLRAHALPKYFGLLTGSITAKNSADYKKLITQFLIFYRDHLNNEHWGEQFSLEPDNKISLFLMSQGLSPTEVKQAWQPMRDWVNQSKGQYTFSTHYINIPPSKMWDLKYWEQHHPKLVTRDTRQNARPGEYWWTPNSGEVYHYWYTYQSWYFPLRLLDRAEIDNTAKVLYKAVRHSPIPIDFHINKGLAGASKKAIAATRKTSMNPSVYNAAALIIMAAGTNKVQLDGALIATPEMSKKVEEISDVMRIIEDLAPHAGTYANEADYFQKDWQKAFWGSNYPKLLQIKQQYDPTALFYCHHCVGSENWSSDGVCKK